MAASGEGADLPAPAESMIPDLPAPVQIPGDSMPELPAPASQWDAELPAPVGNVEEGLFAADEVDLPMPVEDEPDLPAPYEPYGSDLPAPAYDDAQLPSPFEAPVSGLPYPVDSEVNLPSPFSAEDPELPSPVGAAGSFATHLADSPRGERDIWGRTIPAQAGSAGRPEAAAVAAAPEQLSSLQGEFRVAGRATADAIDLDQTELDQEGLARPEFVSPKAPRISEEAEAPAPEPGKFQKILRPALLGLVLLLGLGLAMGFTSAGFFGLGLLGEEETPGSTRQTRLRSGIRRATSDHWALAAEGSQDSGAETEAMTGAVRPREKGVPATDSYVGYIKAMARLKQRALSKDADDKERCTFALTTGFFLLRYGYEKAREFDAREALDATGGDTDETAPYRLAKVALDLTRGKWDDVEEELVKLVEDHPENADVFLLEGELLIRREKYTEAEAALRKALMARSGDPRLVYVLAKSQILAGHVKEGRQRMAEVLQMDEQHPLAILGVAKSMRAEERYAEAVRLLRRLSDEKAPLGPPSLQAEAHRMAGDILVRQGKGEDAVREMTQALAKKEGDAEILADLGRLYYQRGQYMAAFQQYVTINTLGQPRLDATIGQIRSLLAMRKLGEASEAIIKARRKWPKDPQLPYYQGIVFEERDHIKKARAEYQTALGKDPQFFFPTIRLARLLLRERKKKAAKKAILKAVQKNPKAAVLHDGLGDLYVSLGELDEARKSFERAIEIDPDLQSANYNLASVLLNLGEHDTSLQQFLKVQAMGNDTLDLHYGLARSYQALKRFDKAIEEYNAVLALDPDNEEYAFAAGTAYFEKGDYEKARQRFHQTLTLDSKLHRAHFLTAMSFLRQGNPVQAEKRFRIALEYFRDSLEYGFWLAVSLEMQAKDGEAREVYLGLDRVVNRAPKRIKEVPDLYFRLGSNILRDGSPRQAVVYLTRGLSRKEKRAEPWFLTGEALFQLNFYEKAIGFFKEAIKRKRNHVDAHYRTAMASLLRKRQNRGRAIEHFRQVVAQDKEHKHLDAYKHLGYLYRDSRRIPEALKMLRIYLKLAPPDALDRREVDREIYALTARKSTPGKPHGPTPPPKPQDEEPGEE